MARDRAIVLKELLESERQISCLTRRLDTEKSHLRALFNELAVEIPACSPVEQPAVQNRRTPEANMIDSVSRIINRCRAAKITAEQAQQVAMLQISTLAMEKYELTALPQIVRDRVSAEVAQFWDAGML
jgi:hypothetical protein